MVHLLVDRILKVTGKVLDLLNLLLQVAAEPSQGKNDILLNFLSLAGFDNGIPIIDTEELERIVDASGAEESWRGRDVVGSIVELYQSLVAVFVVILDLAEVCNEVLEDLSPS